MDKIAATVEVIGEAKAIRTNDLIGFLQGFVGEERVRAAMEMNRTYGKGPVNVKVDTSGELSRKIATELYQSFSGALAQGLRFIHPQSNESLTTVSSILACLGMIGHVLVVNPSGERSEIWEG